MLSKFILRLKDVVADYNKGKGKHGSKETSEANYKQYLERQFVSIHGQGTPKWAELGRKKEEEEEQHELTKVVCNIAVEFFYSYSLFFKSDCHQPVEETVNISSTRYN